LLEEEENASVGATGVVAITGVEDVVVTVMERVAEAIIFAL